MNKVTNTDVERSYTTLAMLDVCLAAMCHMEDQPDNSSTRILQSNLVTTIKHMKELANQTHDLLEGLEREQVEE